MARTPKPKKLAIADEPIGFNIRGRILHGHCWLAVELAAPRGRDEPNDDTQRRTRRVHALIDTGATMSSIRLDVAEDLGLVSTESCDMASLEAVSVRKLAPACMRVMAEPQRTWMRQRTFTLHARVYDGTPEMLLGMDEILRGELVVDGLTGTWSLMVPERMHGTLSKKQITAWKRRIDTEADHALRRAARPRRGSKAKG